MATPGSTNGAAPPSSSSSSLSDFRAREEHLRRLDAQLNDKKNEVVRRAEELVKQQSERLARLAAEQAAPPASSYGPGVGAGGAVHHRFGAGEQGFLEETTGYRGRFVEPASAAPVSTTGSRPASGAVKSRPISAASQEGRRRASGIPGPAAAGAFSDAASTSSVTAAPAHARAASASRITPSGLASSSRPGSRLSRAPSASSSSLAAAAAQRQQQLDPFASGTGGTGTGRDFDAGAAEDDDALASGTADGDEPIHDDMDALGYGTGGGDGAISSSGMGTAATLRVQRARIAALSSNVSALTASLAEKDKELTEARNLMKSASEGREKTARKLDAAEKSAQHLQKQLDDCTARLGTAEAKAASLDREGALQKRRLAEMEQEAKQKDAKLNRALAELERAKEAASKARSGGGSGGGAGGDSEMARELAALKAANKKLLSQRSDLLTGFRRQSRLVDLLRKQKLHVEMAKMLQFTEEEFARSIDMGEV